MPDPQARRDDRHRARVGGTREVEQPSRTGGTVVSENADPPDLPQPDPALKRLDRLVGSWIMEGNLLGSDEKNIRGETTFRHTFRRL
jgi:hypothetical protein